MKKRILIIDDEIEVRELLKDVLASQGYTVDVALTGEEGLRLLDENYYHLAILDLMLPDIFGMDVLKLIREKLPHCDVIIVSGFPTVETAIKAFKSGCFDYIIKPFDMETIRKTVETCLEKQRFSRDISRLKDLVELNDIKTIIDSFYVPGSIYQKILDLSVSFTKSSGGMLLNIYKKNVPEISCARNIGAENQIKIAQHYEAGIRDFTQGAIQNEAYQVFGKDINRILLKSLESEGEFFGLIILFRSKDFADEFIEENLENLNDFSQMASYILVKYETLKREYF